MRTPLSWLRDFADFPDDVAFLRATLDDLGLVVEDVELVGEGLDDVIAARIDEIAAIEGADKVRRVVVDAGHGPLEIVCGAQNFALGDFVPLAPIGAVLPGGFEIAKRKMRGVTSNGMLCSGKELGLGDDHSGLLLLTNEAGVAPGRKVAELLGVVPDVVFDITVEGNRPDAWCIAGVARELAARLGLSFEMPSWPAMREGSTETKDLVSATVVDSHLCRRLGVAVLESVVIGDSPDWIQTRLRLAGMRPINNVVDASNYVMLELGQPTHPYDATRVAGPGLRVRRAASDESLTTLDGVERVLGKPGRGLGDTGEDCVICDATDQVIGIAGIMGGESSEIESSTQTVLLEAACFDPIAITRTSRRLALRTEASARFSKGTDPGIIETAIARFAALVALSAPDATLATQPLLVPAHAPERAVIDLPLERVTSMLGVDFGARDIADLLSPLGFEVAESDLGHVKVSIPTNRPDIRTSAHGVADLIEEVARAYGYSRLPRRFPSWATPGKPVPTQSLRHTLREVLTGAGASEAWTTSLVAPGDLRLLGRNEPEIVVTNPLTVDESRLRRSLLPGLLRAIGYNAERRHDDLALFEIGKVFIHPEVATSVTSARAGSAGGAEVTLPAEPEMCLALFAREGDDATVAVAVLAALADALGLEGITLDQSERPAGLHPTRSAFIRDAVSGACLGSLGEVDPSLALTLAPGAAGRRVGTLELDLDALADASRATRKNMAAVLPSRFPSSDIELALVLRDEVPASDLLHVLRTTAGELVEDIRLFDVYRGVGVAEGARSLAVRIRLCAEDRTLSESDLLAFRTQLLDAAETLGATLRQ